MGAAAASMPFSSSPTKYELSDLCGGLSMNRLLLKLAMTLLVSSILYSTPGATQDSPTTKKAARIRITRGPVIDRADHALTIIRETRNHPGAPAHPYSLSH